MDWKEDKLPPEDSNPKGDKKNSSGSLLDDLLNRWGIDSRYFNTEENPSNGKGKKKD
jgi:hypothetical protein